VEEAASDCSAATAAVVAIAAADAVVADTAAVVAAFVAAVVVESVCAGLGDFSAVVGDGFVVIRVMAAEMTWKMKLGALMKLSSGGEYPKLAQHTGLWGSTGPL
jgi:hypothetical protein